ncbi:unnamed protein product [Rotaria socialis]|uniref:Uncharacterized protein n=2 Tax=Rotaria socialis TaxID=392032 RepID=A0A817RT53_9BILA|nr:unnamed protein product [Rotaria socialis]
METAGTLNGIYLMREINALNNITFTIGCTEIITLSKSLTIRLDPNGVFVEVMILILAFSTNCSLITFHNARNVMNLQIALPILNVLATIHTRLSECCIRRVIYGSYLCWHIIFILFGDSMSGYICIDLPYKL